jgi:putative DNA primase/helicase
MRSRHRSSPADTARPSAPSTPPQPGPGETESAFARALADAGLAPQDGAIVPADGRLHRFRLQGDRPGRRSGWAVLHANGAAHGVAGSWRSGERITWTPEQRRLSADERRRLDESRRRREAEEEQVQQAAAARARRLWDRLPPASPEHAYLRRKGVPPGPCRQLASGALVLPVVSAESGELTSLQFIGVDGDKRFLAGGKVAGGCACLGEPAGNAMLIVCEGYATGASLQAATGATVAVAFSAGNLMAVARALRRRLPECDLVLAADNDAMTPGNPGLAKATEAAIETGARLAVPPAGDFNDLMLSEGPEAVNAIVAEATCPYLDAPTVELPPGYRMTGTGLWWQDESDDERPPLMLSGPFEVLAETRDADGRAWGILLGWHDHDGRPHEWAMPRAMLAADGAEVRRALLDGGLHLAPGRIARERFLAFLGGVRTGARARAVERTGWHGRAFVLPERCLGAAGDERILLQSANPIEHAYRTCGTLQSWQEEVAALALGNSRLTLALCTAFAAALLELTSSESGGFHLRGPSSTGKSTALAVAGSVWGGGEVTGYVRSWRATANGLEAVAGAHCDTLLCLDEIGQLPAREAGEVAYMLANGMGKSRAARDGGQRKSLRWRLLFLSSGEIGLAEKLAEDGWGRRISAGQQVRIVDVPADTGRHGLFEALHGYDGAGLARHLKQASARQHGHAGPAFVEAIAADTGTMRETMAALIDEFRCRHCPNGADGQALRVAERFALAAAAGELASRQQILPWAPGQASEGVARCFAAWLEVCGSGPAELRDGIAQVRRFLEAHGESRFSAWEANDGRPTFERAGFRRRCEDGETEFFILPEAWRKQVTAGFDAGRLAKALAARGYLLPDGGDGKPASRHRLPGMGPVRCYRLRSTILEADDDR